MVKQKVDSKAKGKPTRPKLGRKRRPNVRIDRVRKKGEMLAGIAGAIIALSSIRWKVSSQTVHGLWYVVTLNSRGLICQCNANAGGRMICWHVFGVHRLREGVVEEQTQKKGPNKTIKDPVQESRVPIRKCGAPRQAQLQQKKAGAAVSVQVVRQDVFWY